MAPVRVPAVSWIEFSKLALRFFLLWPEPLSCSDPSLSPAPSSSYTLFYHSLGMPPTACCGLHLPSTSCIHVSVHVLPWPEMSLFYLSNNGLMCPLTIFYSFFKFQSKHHLLHAAFSGFLSEWISPWHAPKLPKQTTCTSFSMYFILPYIVVSCFYVCLSHVTITCLRGRWVLFILKCFFCS